MFALFIFQERSGISPTTRRYITVRNPYVVALSGQNLRVRVCLMRRIFHMDFIFLLTYLPLQKRPTKGC